MRRLSQEQALSIVRHRWARAEHRQPASAATLFIKDATAIALLLLGLVCVVAGVLGKKEHGDDSTRPATDVVPAQRTEREVGGGTLGHGAHGAGTQGGGA